MESICSLQSQPVTTIPTSFSSLSRHGFNSKASVHNRFLRFPSLIKHPNARKFGYLDLRVRALASSEAVEVNPKKLDSKDKDLAFVAGATGKVGSRTVRELLKLGFRVRAGTRSAQRAENLVQSVREMKFENPDKQTQTVEKLEIVECDLEKRDGIRSALGNASVVICCIGASEKEIADITGPYRIDFQATKNLIDAATAAKVDHFILLTSLGTNKVGFPAAILNLFWGVLIWKRKAEEALIASGLPYTIVRPGGMERPTDSYKKTHNITLSEEDTLFGGQVSNLQVAELIACMAKNPRLSYCKVVEVIAETTSPLTPMEELLTKIPSKRPYIAPPTESVETAAFNTVTGEPKAPSKEALAEEKAEARPLSPYAAYEDLKPPISPTPKPSTSSSTKKASDVDATKVAKEQIVASEDESTASETVTGEPKTPSEEVLTRVKHVESKPLSPYAAYEDFKPPTSPAPTPSTSSGATKASDVELKSSPSQEVPKASIDDEAKQEEEKKTRPLSPYNSYEDLKPPTSPSPTASSGKQDVSEMIGGNDVARFSTSAVAKGPSQTNPPYQTYEEVKSPTSPSPSSAGTIVSKADINGVSETVISPGSNIAQPLVADQPNQGGSKPRPLSPYSMYEDLKPPTSPIPLPSKSIN